MIPAHAHASREKKIWLTSNRLIRTPVFSRQAALVTFLVQARVFRGRVRYGHDTRLNSFSASWMPKEAGWVQMVTGFQ